MLFWKKPAPATVSWEPRAIHLRDRRMFADSNSDLVRQFLARVFSLAEVSAVEIEHGSGLAVVRFSHDQPAAEMLKRLTTALRTPEPVAKELRKLLAQTADQRRRTTNIYRTDRSYLIIPTVYGMQRFAYLVLAGGSFGMSIIGVALPGIPTVPFVILTSYFLVRSSPALNDRLLRSRLFGPILRDWQLHGAVRLRVKWISIGLTMVILVVSVAWIEVSGPLLMVMLAMASLGMYLILRLPTLPEPPPEPRPMPTIATAGAA